jgi:hypothetical protein
VPRGGADPCSALIPSWVPYRHPGAGRDPRKSPLAILSDWVYRPVRDLSRFRIEQVEAFGIPTQSSSCNEFPAASLHGSRPAPG